MTTATTTATQQPGDATASPLHGGRPPVADTAFRLVSLACGLMVLVVLVLIAVSTTRLALPAFREEGLGFVTSRRWAPAEGAFGALAFVYGTLVISAIALVLAVPVSIGMALFLTQIAPRRLRQPVTYLIDLLAAIPSVVYGLWGILVLAPAITSFYRSIADATSGIPLLRACLVGPVDVRSLFPAARDFVLMIGPLATASSREGFATVRGRQKDAGLAVRAARGEQIRPEVPP